MTNLTTKLNKLVLDDSPSEKLINACAEIDIESCFDPIFEPPLDFLEECRKRWENRMNPFTGTVERKIGNTWYLLETVCDGNEPLTHKVKRLIFRIRRRFVHDTDSNSCYNNTMHTDSVS